MNLDGSFLVGEFLMIAAYSTVKPGVPATRRSSDVHKMDKKQ
jgi:hypothetical protein